MIIDENICDLRGLAITTEKKQDYETPDIYIYIYIGWIYPLPRMPVANEGL